MKNPFLWLLVLGVFGISQPVHAADSVSRLQATYQNFKSLTADFVQETYIEILDRQEKRSGKLIFGTDRFRIEYQKPKKQLYIFNGETLWIYTPKYKEVEVYQAASERISREALTFLGGLGRLRETFRIPSVKKKGGELHYTLTPKDRNSRLKKIELSVDPKNYQVVAATLWPKEGNRTHYNFSNLKTDKTPADKVFSFKVPRGVQVRKPEL